MTNQDPPADGPEPITALRRALSRETLPGIETDLLTADVVTTVDVHDGEATVVVDPTAAPETSSEDVMTAVVTVASELPGIDDVDVEQASPGPDITGSVTDFDRVIAVASAKGGVGKSTVATRVASALAARESVALFDADVHGPNVPQLLGAEGPVYSTDEGRPIPIENDGMEVMSIGLLQSDVPLAWRGAMAHEAVSDLFADTAWRSSDTLIIDLPPGTGDVVLTTLEEVPVDGILVVTTPFHTSIVDTNRTIDLFRDEGIPVIGAVVNMAGFTCEACGHENDLFADDRDALRTDVLAELPFDQDMQGTIVPGESTSAIQTLADTVVDELAAVGSFSVPDGALDIRGLPPKARREEVQATFDELDAGDTFTLVSDRDPTPIREYLATLADTDPTVITPFEVTRETPEAWLLSTKHP
jgi:ATP-binding protein involved in chromosome partitioning